MFARARVLARRRIGDGGWVVGWVVGGGGVGSVGGRVGWARSNTVYDAHTHVACLVDFASAFVIAPTCMWHSSQQRW